MALLRARIRHCAAISPACERQHTILIVVELFTCLFSLHRGTFVAIAVAQRVLTSTLNAAHLEKLTSGATLTLTDCMRYESAVR